MSINPCIFCHHVPHIEINCDLHEFRLACCGQEVVTSNLLECIMEWNRHNDTTID